MNRRSFINATVLSMVGGMFVKAKPIILPEVIVNGLTYSATLESLNFSYQTNVEPAGKTFNYKISNILCLGTMKFKGQYFYTVKLGDKVSIQSALPGKDGKVDATGTVLEVKKLEDDRFMLTLGGDVVFSIL
jgi:hypothetical protein